VDIKYTSFLPFGNVTNSLLDTREFDRLHNNLLMAFSEMNSLVSKLHDAYFKAQKIQKSTSNAPSVQIHESSSSLCAGSSVKHLNLENFPPIHPASESLTTRSTSIEPKESSRYQPRSRRANNTNYDQSELYSQSSDNESIKGNSDTEKSTPDHFSIIKSLRSNFDKDTKKTQKVISDIYEILASESKSFIDIYNECLKAICIVHRLNTQARKVFFTLSKNVNSIYFGNFSSSSTPGFVNDRLSNLASSSENGYNELEENKELPNDIIYKTTINADFIDLLTIDVYLRLFTTLGNINSFSSSDSTVLCKKINSWLSDFTYLNKSTASVWDFLLPEKLNKARDSNSGDKTDEDVSDFCVPPYLSDQISETSEAIYSYNASHGISKYSKTSKQKLISKVTEFLDRAYDEKAINKIIRSPQDIFHFSQFINRAPPVRKESTTSIDSSVSDEDYL
ncbi:hypothetical protein BB560_006527, partial [Smittium megazygosporum]